MTLTETAALSQEQDSNNITVREKNVEKCNSMNTKIMLYVKEGQRKKWQFVSEWEYKAQRWHQRLYLREHDRPARCAETPRQNTSSPAITGPAHSSEV